MELQRQLMVLVDADTAAFNGIMEAYGLPKSTDAQKASRAEAIQAATKHAIEVPMRVARLANEAMEVALEMAVSGNPNSITDAGVGAMAIRTGVKGAILNAQVNLQDLKDEEYSAAVRKECDTLWASIDAAEAEIMLRVQNVLKG
jgi:glutamate formiminotransferase/formiminotetrahydrofolate cyclodeaminase